MGPIPMMLGSLLTAAVLAGPAQEEVDPPPPRLERPDLEAWLDGFLPYALRQADIAGAVVVVVTDNEVLLQKGYGHADVAKLTPVDPERTLFRVGSVAKLFTWTAVMQLVESGRLDLDRDINDDLDFTIPLREGQPIVLRNLMTHTPGFEELIKNLMTDEPERHPALGTYLKTRSPGRIFPPGRVPAYSNYGVALAGYLVERVSGEPFDDYVDRHVFRPLRMTNSTTRQPLPARFEPQMSKGYRLASGPPGPFELVGPAPAGGATATGADIGRFMMAFLQGGQLGSARILDSQTVRLMHGTPLPIVPPLNSMLLGFIQRDLNGRRIVAHDGDTQFFHCGLSLLVDDGVGVFVAMNSTGRDPAAIAIRTALIDGFADRYFPTPANDRAVDPQIAAEHARAMAGTYQMSRRAQSSFFSLAYLLLQVEVTVGADGLVIPAFSDLNGRPMKWRETEPFVWQQVGGKRRVAAKVEDGQVVMFSIDSLSPYLMFQPVAAWKSSSLLVPLLIGALTCILLSVMGWPVAALVRRRYGSTFDLTGQEAGAYRLLRLAGIGLLAILAAWAGIVSLLATDLTALSPRLDPWIRFLRMLGLVVFPGATVVALWSAKLAWTRGRGWLPRVWNIALAIACLTALWVAVAFRLIGFSSDY